MEKIDAIASLSALAHETRLDIYRLLVEAGPAGLPAGVIADRIELAGPTLSFHLNHLKHAGLVTYRRESRSLIYSADFTQMNGLVGYLTENCCQGDPAACGLPSCAPATTPATTRTRGGSRDEAVSRARRRQ
ncbi:MAG TPA: metalloregulator ArsR/SmtB family transcription factor [Magnetospirillaceae bacterium]|jgi:DNA-binding transcriptional ArsR family regulator